MFSSYTLVRPLVISFFLVFIFFLLFLWHCENFELNLFWSGEVSGESLLHLQPSRPALKALLGKKSRILRYKEKCRKPTWSVGRCDRWANSRGHMNLKYFVRLSIYRWSGSSAHDNSSELTQLIKIKAASLCSHILCECKIIQLEYYLQTHRIWCTFQFFPSHIRIVLSPFLQSICLLLRDDQSLL